ncbi:UBA [Musa troglodytarum]|uniref:UBA n=1 Tax=Musa troglodytarum TaxID=320322 RepID=A0A9E7HBE0_9LILI|nr:UBA [Musa troglodytarum]
MHAGPTGFRNAPVTRTLVITSAVLSVTSAVSGRPRRLGLSFQDIFENHDLLKAIPSVFAFSSTPELVAGFYLLYYFRVFERQIGSNKYSVFVLFCIIASTFFEILALALLKGFQLLLCGWKWSFIPGICGVLAGFLYRVNAFGIRRLKQTSYGKSSCGFSFLYPSNDSSLKRSHQWFQGYSCPLQQVQHVIQLQISEEMHVCLMLAVESRQQNYPSVGHVSMPEPPESSIATLVSMGFDSNAARQALMQARNDLNVATNILLEAQTR